MLKVKKDHDLSFRSDDTKCNVKHRIANKYLCYKERSHCNLVQRNATKITVCTLYLQHIENITPL